MQCKIMQEATYPVRSQCLSSCQTVRIRIVGRLSGGVPLDSSFPVPCSKQSLRDYHHTINPIGVSWAVEIELTRIYAYS